MFALPTNDNVGPLQAELLMAVGVDSGLPAGHSAVILVQGHVFADPDNTPFLGVAGLGVSHRGRTAAL